MNFFCSRLRFRETCCRYGLAGISIVVLSQSGCHQRAYNELYVENMASEIRLLEDRVYEYDAEYRALENELEDLRLINEGLEKRLREAEQAKLESRTIPKSAPSAKSAPPSSTTSRRTATKSSPPRRSCRATIRP